MLEFGKRLDKDQAWATGRTLFAQNPHLVQVTYKWSQKEGGQEYGVHTWFDLGGLDYATCLDLIFGSGLVVRTQGKIRATMRSTTRSVEEKERELRRWINNSPMTPIKVAVEFLARTDEADPYDLAISAMMSAGLDRAAAAKAVDGAGLKAKAASGFNPVVFAGAQAKAKAA